MIIVLILKDAYPPKSLSNACYNCSDNDLIGLPAAVRKLYSYLQTSTGLYKPCIKLYFCMHAIIFIKKIKI